MPHDLQSGGESLLNLDLQAVVAVARVAPVVAKVLRPAELLEIGFPLVRRQGAKPNQGGLIRIIIAASSRKDVRSVVAYVSGLHRDSGGELPLYAEIPRVDGWQAQPLGDHE